MQDYLAALTPQYWQFWIGLVLVILVLIGRERMGNWTAPIRALLAHAGRLGRPGGPGAPAAPTDRR
jgi:branched-chain amino acid transport system permease protein